MSYNKTELCRFEWNPGVWPYVATCILPKGHPGHTHTAMSGQSVTA